MESGSSTKLEQLRSRHRKLRDKSYQKLEESRQLLQDSEEKDQHISHSVDDVSVSEVDQIGSSTTSFIFPEVHTPQHKQIVLANENDLLRKQVSELAKDRVFSRKQQEEIQRLKQEIQRLNQKFQLTLEDKNEELVRLKQETDKLREELSLRQGELRQLRFGGDTAATIELLNGLEIREPDSNRRLLELKDWLKKMTQHERETGDFDGEYRIEPSEVYALNEEMEEAILRLRSLRRRLDETESEEIIRSLQSQIEIELERWHRLNETLTLLFNQEKKGPFSRNLITSVSGEENKAAHSTASDITLQAKKLQTVFLDIRTLAIRNIEGQHQVQTSKGNDCLDEVQGRDNCFSSFFQIREAEDVNEQEEAAPPSDGEMIVEVNGDGIDENSNSTSSSETDYFPASNMQDLTTIFEFQCGIDSNSESSQESVVEGGSLDLAEKPRSADDLMKMDLDGSKGTVYEPSLEDVTYASVEEKPESIVKESGKLVVHQVSHDEGDTPTPQNGTEDNRSKAELTPVDVSAEQAIGPNTFSDTTEDGSLVKTNGVHQQDDLLSNDPSLSELQVQVVDERTGSSRDMTVPISENLNLYDSVYNYFPSLSVHARSRPDDIALNVKNESAQIRCFLVDSVGKDAVSFSVDDLKAISTKAFARVNSGQAGFHKLVIRCVKMGRVIKDKMNLPQIDLRSRNYMRIQIKNEITERVKALVLPVLEEANLYDVVYNDNATVKSGYIGEWPSEIIQAVKLNKLEIKCILLDNNGSTIHAYSISDLKMTSTKDVYEMATSRSEVINLVLRCQKVRSFNILASLKP
jgi:hypothetical protein